MGDEPRRVVWLVVRGAVGLAGGRVAVGLLASLLFSADPHRPPLQRRPVRRPDAGRGCRLVPRRGARVGWTRSLRSARRRSHPGGPFRARCSGKPFEHHPRPAAGRPAGPAPESAPGTRAASRRSSRASSPEASQLVLRPTRRRRTGACHRRPADRRSDKIARNAQGTGSGRTARSGRRRTYRPRRGLDQGVAPADPADGRLVAEERLRPRQGPTREPPPALAVVHRTGDHVPDLARHGPTLSGGPGSVEPARRGRRRRRPAAVGSRPQPAAGRRVLRRPGHGHRRCRVRQDPDHGGASGLRRPPPRHAARGGRLPSPSRTRPPRRSGSGRANACRASRWARSTSSRAGC